MSFYDLTKSGALSAQELFKYRVKRDSTIPSRGGQKDFEPDNSWLQTKAVETFIQERTSVLGEPRVEKLKSLVKGTWESDKHLVNVEKTGKFWHHMGFTDQRRNWLYPEEALFLMEINSLEVYEHGLPLSIQEAYNKFLSGGGGVSLQEYQVFAHLRRLGFVVLRHEQPVLTEYEKQINLHKYITKQALKERKNKNLKKKKNKESESVKITEEESGPQTEQNGITKDILVDDDLTSNGSKNDLSVSDNRDQPAKKQKLEENISSNHSPTQETFSDSSETNKSNNFYDTFWSDCFQSKSQEERTESKEKPKSSLLHQTAWPDNAMPLPDIGGKVMLTLKCPTQKFLPPNLQLPEESEFVFDVEEYRIKNPTQPLTRQAQKEEERDTRIRALDFSFAEWTQRKPKVAATNWADYKAKVAERMHDLAHSTPVDHLYRGDVTPLCRPGDATSFSAIQDKLSIIESVDNKDLQPISTILDNEVELKISYDVHLPDHRFKKSMPSTPNHRVCVTECSTDPPGLSLIQRYWHLYKDNVPLHWAVVDSGEIAFYIFNNLYPVETL